MKKQFLVVCLILPTICGAQPGIQFQNKLSWSEVKSKARGEGKFIFIDAYNSQMSDMRNKNIYVTPEVGSFINEHFISYQIQTDTTEFDNENVKMKYAVANEITGLLNNAAFPAFLFFDPSGKLVHAYPIAQALSPEVFLEEAGNALDSSKQYFSLVTTFRSGKLPYPDMPYLFSRAQLLKDVAIAKEIAKKYINGYVLTLPGNKQLSKQNISMAAWAISSTGDKGFDLFMKKGEAIDNIMGAKDFAGNIVEYVIANEIVRPQLQKMAFPNWNAIQQAISKRYGSVIADRVVLSQKVGWYDTKKDWPKFADAFLTKIEKYGYDTSWLGTTMVNNTIYEVVFKYIDDTSQLRRAAKVMELLLKTNPNKPSWLDTYANLLYKTGEKSKAIAIQQRAVMVAPNDEELQQSLRKMQSGKLTGTSGVTGLKTKWSIDVSSENVLADYPRPMMVRTNWMNLNGYWEYAITDSAANKNTSFPGKILVPFPLESTLSGVKKILQPEEKLWYRKVFNLKAKQAGKRYLLHFGAVDYETVVYVNDREVGRHTGGYQQFSFDITEALQKGSNAIIVSVLDPTDKGNNPHGKQVLEPQGIMYTPTSGIWQTTWIETVPSVYISGLTLTPDIDRRVLMLHVAVMGVSNDYTVEVAAKKAGSVKGAPNSNLSLPVPEAHLWSPTDPYLYDLSVKLLNKGKVVDSVMSYFGMRKIEIKRDEEGQERIFLNNHYTFNMGVLDQGFWPDGIYTAPTDDALKFDIETIKGMGFNTIRKHIKIEPARWYYWCDKLGMLVWQDMPYPANLTTEAKAQFERENEQNIKQLYNNPSIICWVLFNEGWNRYDQARLTAWVKKADSTRLINGHSGENYDKKSPNIVKEKWINSDMTDVHDYPGPDIAPHLPGKARVLGEWGGVRVVTPGHQWDETKSWGYIESDATDFARKYEFMMKHLKLFEEEGLSAAIYTQPFDVEIEENGLLTYDRKVFKIPMDKIKNINESFLQNANASGITSRK